MGLFGSSKPKEEKPAEKQRDPRSPVSFGDLSVLNENVLYLTERINYMVQIIEAYRPTVTTPSSANLKEVSFLEAVEELQPKTEVKPERTPEERKAFGEKMKAARKAKRIVKPEKREIIEAPAS